MLPESAINGDVPPPHYNTIEPPAPPPPNDLPLAYHYDYYQQYAIPKPEDVHQPTRPSYPPPRYTPRQTGEFICYMNPVVPEEIDAEARRRQRRYVSRTYMCCLAIFSVVGLVSFGITKAST
ncbi:hypothetical protein INT44_003702 [Umbelopsis vinacea]|uniref:Uncharacterized protein n=1 Tax=Umbelopsis vinacea TaxID=44442 RepID=A0A8H7UF48_9FUNG|nr:hypothetical protein INT44_003702 [Umbelopsis vinacea]